MELIGRLFLVKNKIGGCGREEWPGELKGELLECDYRKGCE